MKLHVTLLYLVLFVVLPTIICAQERRGRPPLTLEKQWDLAIQTVNLLSPEPDKSRLDISYRIPKSFFIFTKDLAPSANHPFSAKGEISIELLDSNKTSVAQKLKNLELFSADASASATHGMPETGIFSFDLTPGTYTVVIEVNDKNSNRTFREDSRIVKLRDFSQSNLTTSDIVFSDPLVEMPQHELIPYNIGGDILYGKNTFCYFQVNTLTTRDSLLISYHVTRSTIEEKNPIIVLSDTLQRNNILPAKILTISQHDSRYHYIISDSMALNGYACMFTIASATFELGTYQLDVTVEAGTQKTTLKKNFQLRWLDMPSSLRQLKVAVDAMEYILSEDEYKELRSANATRQRKLFDDFWRKRDQTPQSSYNEVMAEYFKRVDYAFTHYGTLQEQHGVKTERGKAYILYGPPSSVERKLLPSSDPQEIWIYTNIHKKLTFVDEHRNGNYKLVAAESL